MRGLITGLFGFALVMYVAGWVGYASGVGVPVPTAVLGIMATGGGLTLLGLRIFKKL